MKKVTIAVFVFVVLASFLTSCKTNERCPAYGKVKNESAEKHS